MLIILHVCFHEPLNHVRVRMPYSPEVSPGQSERREASKTVRMRAHRASETAAQREARFVERPEFC